MRGKTRRLVCRLQETEMRPCALATRARLSEHLPVIKSVCVYSASSDVGAPKYFAVVAELGELIAREAFAHLASYAPPAVPKKWF